MTAGTAARMLVPGAITSPIATRAFGVGVFRRYGLSLISYLSSGSGALTY